MNFLYTIYRTAFIKLLGKVLAILFVLNMIAMPLRTLHISPKPESFSSSLHELAYSSVAYRFSTAFDFSLENNLPSYFSFFLLASSAALLFILSRIAPSKSRRQWKWYALGYIFVFLALDELLGIHEAFGKPTSSFLKDKLNVQDLGFLYYAWFIPYGIILLCIVTYFMKFILSLPRRVYIQILLAGGSFVFAAIGMEMVEGKVHSAFGKTNLVYGFLYSIEEALEMSSIILFINSLLTYSEIIDKPAAVIIHLPARRENGRPVQ